MSASIDCPVCGVKCDDARPVGTKDVTDYDCPRCGKYSIARQAVTNLGNSEISKRDRAKVAAWL